MAQPDTKNIQVAIVGGGVCGLACAVALQNAGVHAEVFEAAAAFGEIGAGIGIGPNAVRALEAMGILDAVRQKLPPGDLSSRGFLFYSGIGEHKLIYDYPPAPEDISISMHRAVFLDALIGLVDPRRTHFNKRCVSVSESPANPHRVVITFVDGTTHEADIVLGADGIKSAVRDFVMGGGGAAVGGGAVNAVAFSNTMAYRGLIPHMVLKNAGFKLTLTDRPACFVGPNKHIIVVPIKNGEIINVAAFSANYDFPIGSQNLPEGQPWVDTITRQELQQEFDGWGTDVSTLLQHMPEKSIRWSVHVVHPPLGSYVRGHVALLGDAAHGMLPHLGAGAGTGIEDAYTLARLLSHQETNNRNVAAVLEAYSQARQPRAEMIWEASRRAGSIYDSHGQLGTTTEGMNMDLKDLWKPIWSYDVENDVVAVIDGLRTSGTFD